MRVKDYNPVQFLNKFTLRKKIASLLVFVIFSVLFSKQSFGKIDFWWAFASICLILSIAAFHFRKDWREEISSDFSTGLLKKVMEGIVSAVVLYLLFYTVNLLGPHLFSDFQEYIGKVYSLKKNVSVLKMFLLIVFIIGPVEEIFWRGFVQHNLMAALGRWKGLLLASLFYALIHLGSLNPLLVIAALTCGVFWGVLYMHRKSLVVNIISHVVWDVAIFLLFPLS